MRLFLPSIFVLLLASCGRKYWIGTIDSSLQKADTSHLFLAENDTLALAYSFNGYGGHVIVNVKNKLDVPLFVNWGQSSMMINDIANSFVPGEVVINGQVNSSGVAFRGGYTSSSGTINATVTNPVTGDFIPPHARIAKISSIRLIDAVARVNYKQKPKVPVNTNVGMICCGWDYAYTEADSPVRLRSYLTFTVGEASGKQVVVQNQFFLSILRVSRFGRTYVADDQERKADWFFFRWR